MDSVVWSYGFRHMIVWIRARSYGFGQGSYGLRQNSWSYGFRWVIWIVWIPTLGSYGFDRDHNLRTKFTQFSILAFVVLRLVIVSWPLCFSSTETILENVEMRESLTTSRLGLNRFRFGLLDGHFSNWTHNNLQRGYDYGQQDYKVGVALRSVIRTIQKR